MTDIDGLLAEVSADAPCGEDLEYDPAFGELERAIQSKPEQQFGDTIVPAEEPDWPQVEREAVGLLARTKDLRVAAHLTRALARTRGWPGFRDGLILLKGLLDRFWEDVHPRLDPDDDNDPTLRVNTLITLCDQEATLDGLRAAPLVVARGLGSFSLRDVQIASKELPPPKDAKGPPPDMQLIEAAFQEADLDQLQATVGSIAESLQLLKDVDRLLTGHIGIDATPDLSPLQEVIQMAHKTAAAPLAARTGVEIADPEAADAGAEAQEAPISGGGKPLASGGVGTINTRADVTRALDLLIDYYRRQEPSSPIPLLLIRAKRLVSKDFLEILEDLAPDGLSQARVIRGPESNS